MIPTALAVQLAYHVRAERLGRRRLAAQVGSSEMTVRIELDRMRDAGWIVMDRSGVRLTECGERAFRSFLEHIRSVETVDLTGLQTGQRTWAAHIKPQKVPSAWLVRDEAIREGASGCILLVFELGEWTFAHNGEPVRSHNPGDADTIEREFPHATQGDLLVIVSAETGGAASCGLWSVIRFLRAG